MNELRATFGKPEEAIMRAISDAKKANRKIVKIGIPKVIQEQIAGHKVGRSDRMKQFYGIKVVTSKTLQITTEFSQLLWL